MSGSRVQIERLRTAPFDGIETHGGKFRVHLELAALAIALKRRVLVLQAVEHAQLSDGNAFAHFIRILRNKRASTNWNRRSPVSSPTSDGRASARPAH
jgi:hypothetical protein